MSSIEELDECLKTRSALECASMGVTGGTVSPSGKSIVESVGSREADPTVSSFQKGRDDIWNSITSLFSIFGKPCIQGIPVISSIPCWLLIFILILILVAIIMLAK